MEVVADVDEADIAGVVEGARVTFTVDAYPEDVFEGKYDRFAWEVQTAAQAAVQQAHRKQL